MSLENTVAKYEVTITRSGDGAAQAAQEFKNLDTTARQASDTADSASLSFKSLHESHLLGRDSLHALNGVMLIAGTERITVLREAVMSLHGGMNLLQGVAKVTGEGFAGMSAIMAVVTTFVLTGVEAFKAFKAEQMLVASNTEYMTDLLERQTKAWALIAKYRDKGLMSSDDAVRLSTQLGSGNAADIGKVERQMIGMGLTQYNVDRLEQLKTLQHQISEDTLSQYDKERAKAADLYSQRMQQIQSLAKENKLLAPGVQTAAEQSAGTAYSKSVNAITAKEIGEKQKAEIQALEDDITLFEQQGAKDRAGLADQEFNHRYDSYKKMVQEGTMTEDELTQHVIAAEKQRQEGVLAEQRAAAAAQRQLEQERKSETDGMIRSFNQREQLATLQSKGSKKEILDQEYQDRLAFDAALYDDARITNEKLIELDQEAQIKYEQGLKAMEQKESLHTMTMLQMEQTVAQNFASGMAGAIVSFVDGTKTAQQAFEDFAKSFLEQIAQMIIQQEILNALKATLFGGGGTATASSGSPAVYAADGLSGISSVSSPTYFPRFNVIAGEAGHEMLTVLARPRMMDIGGIQAVVGQAGRNTLAIANANQLAAAQGAGGAGGHMVIEIAHSDEAKANIIASSIQGAEIHITQRLTRQSPIRTAARQAVR